MMDNIPQKIKLEKRGQVAFEFLIIYTLFMVLFIASIYFASQKAMYQQIYAEQVYAREIGVRFAQEINTAARFNGYEKNYTFSDTIRGSKYDLNISGGTLILTFNNQTDFYYPLMTKDIILKGVDTSSTSNGINTSLGAMTLRNVDGEIRITQ